MVVSLQMGEPDTLVGRILGGRYRLERQLGEGGFGTIWRAEQLVLGAPVALKLIDLAIARQAGALERFLREAQASAALRSPHVVQVLDYGVEGDQPFIAMELLEGETLAERLHRVGRLAPSEALRVVTHVARAMSRAHECNIVHRDLKPENVFLVRNEDDEIAKVLDFGVAKMKSSVFVAESAQTRTGSLIGTPHYMSPEQVQGNKTVDFRSDLWALGIIAFEMFTGQRPFLGNALGDLVLQICVRDIPKPSQIAPVPAGFDEWFARASERDQEKRFQSARDLALTLREVVGGSERETSLVVSDDIDFSRDIRKEDSSSEMLHVSESSSREGKGPSLELAETMRGPGIGPETSKDLPNTSAKAFSNLHAASNPVRGSWQSKSVVTLLIAVAIATIASLGVWYQSSKRVRQSRISYVPAFASNGLVSDITTREVETSPWPSARLAVPSARPPTNTRAKNLGVSQPFPRPGAAPKLRSSSDFSRSADAATQVPALAPTGNWAVGGAASAPAMQSTESPGSGKVPEISP